MRTPASSAWASSRARAVREVPLPPAASSRELLASELAEAQSALAALQGRLRGTREATAELRRRCATEEAEGPRRLRRAEERAAEHCQTNHELRQLQHALVQVGRRHQTVRETSASNLYAQWRAALDAHVRDGGLLDVEDFPFAAFLKQVSEVVPARELEAKESATADLKEDLLVMKARIENVEETEAVLLGRKAQLVAESAMLRMELQEQRSTNQGWGQGRLSDSAQKHQIREEQEHYRNHGEELQVQLLNDEAQLQWAVAATAGANEEAAELKGLHDSLCRRRALLEEHICKMQGGGAQLRKKVEAQEYELGRHRLVRVWSSEASELRRVGQMHQNEALAFLRSAARVRADTENAEEELQRLWARIGEAHREATAQREALGRTGDLRGAVEKDVLGLRETSAFLAEQQRRVQLGMDPGPNSPALKELPETYAGSSRPKQYPSVQSPWRKNSSALAP
eukprot:s668_g14.t1